MIVNFELSHEGARRIGSGTTMAEASGSLSEGWYTTLLVREGRRVLDFAAHVRRLAESSPGGARIDPSSLASGLLEALEAEQMDAARVRVTWCPPRLFASLGPREPLPATLYQRGVACETIALRRSSPRRKDTRFIAAAASARQGLGADVHEGLMTDADGAVLEGLSSNFFAVRAGELWTAGQGVLPGLTRRRVLDLAADSMPIRLEPVGAGELGEIGDAFLTSASRGVLPVVEIDGRVIGSGVPGRTTQKLGEELEAARARESVALVDLVDSPSGTV